MALYKTDENGNLIKVAGRGDISGLANKDLGNAVPSQSIKSTFTSYPMPSTTYESLATSSSSVYTAPANGWYCAKGTTTTKYHGQVTLTNANGMATRSQLYGAADTGCRCYLPAKKGDKVTFTSQSVDGVSVSFYYAEGEI